MPLHIAKARSRHSGLSNKGFIMRKHLLVPAFLLALAQPPLCGPVGSTARAQDKSHLTSILETNTLRVGTTGDFNPMSIRDPATNSFKGLEIDAANQLAKDLGVKLEFVPTDWTTLVPGITANRYDIFMSGASMNPGRIKAIAFTLPYLEAGTTPIFDQKNAAKFKSWDDINQPGITVAVILGTVFEDQAKLLLPKATLKSVQPPATSWQEVLAGRADAAITSSIDAQSIVARFPTLVHLPGDQDKSKRPFGYIVAQGDFVWTNYLNNWITLKISEGYFQSLKTKWFNN
jgi:cyclohexadienyl dehydratase